MTDENLKEAIGGAIHRVNKGQPVPFESNGVKISENYVSYKDMENFDFGSNDFSISFWSGGKWCKIEKAKPFIKKGGKNSMLFKIKRKFAELLYPEIFKECEKITKHNQSLIEDNKLLRRENTDYFTNISKVMRWYGELSADTRKKENKIFSEIVTHYIEKWGKDEAKK